MRGDLPNAESRAEPPGDEVVPRQNHEPRSREVFDREFLSNLISLNKKQPWLEDRSERLLDLLSVCESAQERSLVTDLLHRFYHVDSKLLRTKLDQIVSQVVSGWGCKPASTRVVATTRGKHLDSSQMIGYMLKPRFSEEAGWNSSCFYAGIRDALFASKNGDDLILIDEFCGSGTTISSLKKWLVAECASLSLVINIRLCVLTAMRKSEPSINNFSEQNFVCSWLDRGISDHFSGAALTEAVTSMQRLESALCDVSESGSLKKYHFGFKKTESLYVLENGNVPNNVFPIFWWKWLKGEIRRRPLLERTS